MATRFQVKRSSVGGVRPTTSDIQPGELAVNINDRILFSANSTTVFEVGSNLTSLAVGNSTVRFTVNATHVAISNSMALTANGSNGTSGQVLSSNGTGIYWSTPASAVNTAAQYVWTNTHTFQNTVTFSTANAIVLPVGNTASRPSASNGMIRYNTNTGLVEVVANSTWTGLMTAYSAVREQFTASNNQTTFTVTGGYIPGQVDVYYNGVKLRNGTEVTVSSGSTVVLDTAASNGALLEVVGTGPSFVISNTSQIAYQQFTATSNQTTFTVTNGYVPGLVDVFVDGVKMVNGTDVNVSSGSNVVLASGIPNGSIVEVKGYSTPLVSAQSTTAVRQTFTANSTVNNNFTVAGGYIAGQVDVYYNGAKLVNGTDVNTSSGTTIVLTSNAAAGAVVDVVGINYYTSGGGVTTPVRQTFVANSTVNTTFTIASGYSPGQIDVYRNGVKMVPGTDVNVSSGSTITLTTAAANGDTVEVVGFSAVAIGDAVRKSGDTMSANLVMGSNSSIQVNNLSVVSPADTISVSANLSPATGNTYDLGSTSARWRNIYTNDLNLSNGLGDYTIVEGEDDLFLYNNKRGKVYKFALIEVKPEDAPKKIGE